MNNPYVLPVCFAAVAHGALLFGFSKPPSRPLESRPTMVYALGFTGPTEDDPAVVIERENADTAPKARSEIPPPPKSAEPAAVPVPGVNPAAMLPPGMVAGPDAGRLLEAFIDARGNLGDRGGAGGSRWGEVVGSGLLDASPRTRFQAAPIYPFEAKRAGLRGEVMVEFIVDEHGRVVEPRVMHASHPMFEEATLRALAKWQFEPGRRNGRIVRFRMAVPIIFNVEE